MSKWMSSAIADLLLSTPAFAADLASIEDYRHLEAES
jgi:hypothetical protein